MPYGRLYRAIAQVCLCHSQLCLRLLYGGLCHMVGIHAGGHHVFAHDSLRGQLLVRLILQLGRLHLRLGCSQVRLGVLNLQLVLCLVDDKKRLPLCHHDAVLEVHLADDARHLWEDLHLAHAM